LTPIIAFERVGKRYKLHRDRPRSFREVFVRRRLAGRPVIAEPDTLWALRDASFEIEPGETVGLIGSNGAGKSTALKLISRVVQPNEGRLTVNGRVAALLELGTGFHPELSGRDNIYLSGALSGMGRDEMSRKYDPIVEFAELAKFIDVPVKHYSSGMFARLAFAVSIHIDPDVLLVDEVLAVGDHNFQQKCLERIAELKRAGMTIVFVSHDLETVKAICQRTLWIQQGQVWFDGPADQGVERYLNHVITGQAERASAAGGANRWGNRAIEIQRVRLTNSDGAPQAIFRTGEPLVIQLDYRARTPVELPVFGIAIHRQDGVHVCGPNTTFSDRVPATVSGDGTVTYSVPRLPLLDGHYQLTVAAVNRSDTEIYDYHDRLYSFQVANRPGDHIDKYGLVTLCGEWHHLSA
jgi:lipopolysaccharide transport system ATP-binding protein